MRLSRVEYTTATQPPWPSPTACALDQGTLRFSWAQLISGEDGKVRVVAKPAVVPDSGVWERFANLATASDERIRRFAAKYGPLERPYAPQEELSVWRHHAEVARALTNVAGSVKMGETGDLRDWEALCGAVFSGQAPQPPTTVPEWKMLLAQALAKWMNLPGQFQVAVRWAGDYPDTVLVPIGLLGLIGDQISNAIGASGRKERCAGCGDEFEPQRRATTGKRRYCSGCRERKRPQRDAMRDYRADLPFRKRRKREPVPDARPRKGGGPS